MCLVKFLKSLSEWQPEALTSLFSVFRQLHFRLFHPMKHGTGLKMPPQMNLEKASCKTQDYSPRWCHARYEILPASRDQVIFLLAFLRSAACESGILQLVLFLHLLEPPIPLDYWVNVSFISDHRQTSISSRGVMYQLLNLELQEAQNTGSASLISPCICFVSWSEVREQKEYLAQDTDSHAVRSPTVLSKGEG